MSKKKLGFGLMRLPVLDREDNTTIDYEHVNKMVDQFMKDGFTYFDTAAPYHKSFSEVAFRECVAKRYPRDSYTITDKLSLFMIDRKEDIPGFFDAQLERCGIEYFDYYWLHALSKEAFEKAEAFDAFSFVAQKKAEGKTKHIGFSFHDSAEVLDEILTKHPEMEYVQLQINYADWEDSEVQSRKCYEVCVKHGKPVIVMEPVKGGLLANVPAEAERLMKEAEPEMSSASWAIRFAASLENVMVVLSGMSNEEQMADNLSYMKDFRPLDEKEKELIGKVNGVYQSMERIACTGCRYCVDGCPQQIAIPDYFRLVNIISKFGETRRKAAKSDYAELVGHGHGRASECVGCLQCEEHCPQHLPITKYLKDVAATLED